MVMQPGIRNFKARAGQGETGRFAVRVRASSGSLSGMSGKQFEPVGSQSFRVLWRRISIKGTIPALRSRQVVEPSLVQVFTVKRNSLGGIEVFRFRVVRHGLEDLRFSGTGV